MYMNTHSLIYTHVSSFCQLRGPTSNDIPIAKVHLVALMLVLRYGLLTSLSKESVLLLKQLILELGQEIYNISLEHLVML